MGGGSWTTDTYAARAAAKRAAGKSTFDYSDTARRTGVYTVHADLDPKWIAGDKSPNAGKVIRESCDSDEHPNSTPIAVFFDVTGSMGHIPQVLQQKLPKLLTLLLQKGYVEDPQVLFGAVGDTRSDRVPLQIGQFESDNRMDDNLENFILEGGGGGGNHESYNLAAYYMARHTHLDSLEKRGKKGYLFFIGDERAYKNTVVEEVREHIGDNLQADLSTAEIFRELRDKYDVYFLFAAEGSYEPSQVITAPMHDGDAAINWNSLVGQNALILEDATAVCEMIASTIAVAEGVAELDDVIADLTDVGTDAKTIGAVSKALAAVGSGSNALAAASGGDLDIGDDSDAERL